jgi:hypothetical protein
LLSRARPVVDRTPVGIAELGLRGWHNLRGFRTGVLGIAGMEEELGLGSALGLGGEGDDRPPSGVTVV